MSIKQSAERSRSSWMVSRYGVIISKSGKIKLTHKSQSGIAQGLCAKNLWVAFSDPSRSNEEKILLCVCVCLKGEEYFGEIFMGIKILQMTLGSWAICLRPVIVDTIPTIFHLPSFPYFSSVSQGKATSVCNHQVNLDTSLQKKKSERNIEAPWEWERKGGGKTRKLGKKKTWRNLDRFCNGIDYIHIINQLHFLPKIGTQLTSHWLRSLFHVSGNRRINQPPSWNYV